jgi:uncharacterized protein YgiM (DUF1202 family)
MKTQKIILTGLLTITTLLTSVLPSFARPATIKIEANVRAGASLHSSVLDGLPVGIDVEVLRVVYEPKRGDYWYYLRSTGQLKTQGWVRSNLVSFFSSKQVYGTLLGEPNDVINIRSGPSLDYSVKHMGVMGDLVQVNRSEFIANHGSRAGYNWHNITYPNGATGWVRGDLINVWLKGCIVTCPEN